jgi:hypothetical protein
VQESDGHFFETFGSIATNLEAEQYDWIDKVGYVGRSLGERNRERVVEKEIMSMEIVCTTNIHFVQVEKHRNQERRRSSATFDRVRKPTNADVEDVYLELLYTIRNRVGETLYTSHACAF